MEGNITLIWTIVLPFFSTVSDFNSDMVSNLEVETLLTGWREYKKKNWDLNLLHEVIHDVHKKVSRLLSYNNNTI